MKVNVYIDGFNLYYGALKDRPSCKWLDLDALARELLLPGQTLNRIRYFTARVGGRVDAKAPQRQDTYLRALKTIPHLTVHEGTFKTNEVTLPLACPPATGSRMAKVLKTEEKGSDVNLATYLLLDAFQRDADVAIVVSDDFDLMEPLRLTREVLELTVGVVSPRQRKWLRSAVRADFYRPIRERTLSECQFPERLRDAKGPIRRPAAWS